MSKPTGGKPGRPPKQIAIPATAISTPRPTDPIAAIIWTMEIEAAKEKPNPTRAGLLKGQLDALMRDRDRADGIASDQQRIALEAALVTIDELTAKYDAECSESEAAIKALDQECDELYEKATAAEVKVTETIAAALAERETYLKNLHEVTQSAEAMAEKCVRGECPSSLSRQKEIDRTREPARKMEMVEATVRGIEDDRSKATAARAQRAEILQRAAVIKARPPKPAGLNLANYKSYFEVGRAWFEDQQFLDLHAAIIAEGEAEDAAAKVSREKAEAAGIKEKERQKWLDVRSNFGADRMRLMLAERHAKNPASPLYEDLFGPDTAPE